MDASVTNSNRHVRTRTHGGVAGSAGDRRPHADQTRLWRVMSRIVAHLETTRLLWVDRNCGLAKLSALWATRARVHFLDLNRFDCGVEDYWVAQWPQAVHIHNRSYLRLSCRRLRN